MKKYLLAACILSFSVLADLPQCAEEQVTQAINTFQADATLRSTIQHLQSLVRAYPRVKNCTELKVDLDTVRKRYNQITREMRCKQTSEQRNRISSATNIARGMTDEEQINFARYMGECYS